MNHCSEGEGPRSSIASLICLYVLIKFISELIGAVRQWPFSYVQAQASTHITKIVYTHIQNQGLQFHLSRETGKILRAVQKGSDAFVSIMNIIAFQSLPVLVKIVLVSVTILTLYDITFLLVIFGTMSLYMVANYFIQEWRSHFFKDKSKKDQGFNQKAIDSLFNFETVKYFSAEDHERDRFYKSLLAYKQSQIRMVQSMKC
mmetsp:Transcript_11580/g.19572  ORF Transcript_11580/g.19572 Transcript_11580/m.19572 type:complete len:202 (+) Transcript_11580:442-1047(+)